MAQAQPFEVRRATDSENVVAKTPFNVAAVQSHLGNLLHPQVHYHPHINVDVTPSWDNLNYEHCTMDDGACISSGVSALYYH